METSAGTAHGSMGQPLVQRNEAGISADPAHRRSSECRTGSEERAASVPIRRISGCAVGPCGEAVVQRNEVGGRTGCRELVHLTGVRAGAGATPVKQE